jgi:hypothetical protein
MTYPPQPGGQPHPYAQPGQPVGSPSHPGQPPYPQVQQGIGYPYGGMPFGQPPQTVPPAPKNKRTGLWVGLSLAIAAVTTFGVTGFVAPGFLLGDESEADNGTADTAYFGDSDSGAAAVAEQVARTFPSGGYAALKQLVCPSRQSKLRATPYSVTRFEVTSGLREQQNPPNASFQANVDLVHEGERRSYTVKFVFTPESGAWCLFDIDSERI